MMMSQERAFLKARQQWLAMETFVEQAVEDEQRIDQVERELFSQLLAVGRTLLTALRPREFWLRAASECRYVLFTADQ